MARPTTIELPRLENESARAYAARVEYVTMGAGRSQEAVSQKLAKSRQLLSRWSAQYGWADSAAKYDSELALMTVNEALDAHRADLEAHRKEAMDSGRVLLQLANGLAKTLADALQQPRIIEGKDGKKYTLHKVVADASTLTTIGRAYTAALDLKAHALGVDAILGKLADDSE
jgi:type IV secretory pathway VirJ component